MNIPLLLTTAGMEFCWLSGFISILLVPFWGFSLPVCKAILIFGLGTIITNFSSGKGWLVIKIILIHMIGMVISLLISIQTYYYPHSFIFKIDLALEIFNQIKSGREWFYLIALIISTLILWSGGIFFARRPREYNIISNRFDKGIAIFAFIIILEGVMGTKISSGLLIWFAFYFIFSIMAIAIARGTGKGNKEYISGYVKTILIIGFVLIIAIIITLTFIYGFPYLTEATNTISNFIKKITRPFVPLLIKIIKFLLGVQGFGSSGGYSPQDGSKKINVTNSEKSWLLTLIEKILGHLFMIVIIIITIILIGFILNYLIRWLFSKTDNKQSRVSFKNYFYRLYSLFKKILAKLTGKNNCKIISIYNKLLKWGKISGLSKISSETPREYSKRLKDCFPFLEEEINIITKLFNKKIYGNEQTTDKEIDRAKASWREIRNFRHWFYFLKHLITKG